MIITRLEFETLELKDFTEKEIKQFKLIKKTMTLLEFKGFIKYYKEIN